MTAFENWFKNIVSRWEGNISNRPRNEDPAGFTNHGVTIGTWKAGGAKVLGKEPTLETLKKITFNDAQAIAKSMYWDRYKVDTVKREDLKPVVAESYWMGGGISSLGFKSISALNTANPSLQTVLDNRLKYLKKLSNYEANKNGWNNRLKTTFDVCSKLLSPAGVSSIVILLILILIVWKSQN